MYDQQQTYENAASTNPNYEAVESIPPISASWETAPKWLGNMGASSERILAINQQKEILDPLPHFWASGWLRSHCPHPSKETWFLTLEG